MRSSWVQFLPTGQTLIRPFLNSMNVPLEMGGVIVHRVYRALCVRVFIPLLGKVEIGEIAKAEVVKFRYLLLPHVLLDTLSDTQTVQSRPRLSVCQLTILLKSSPLW